MALEFQTIDILYNSGPLGSTGVKFTQPLDPTRVYAVQNLVFVSQAPGSGSFAATALVYFTRLGQKIVLGHSCNAQTRGDYQPVEFLGPWLGLENITVELIERVGYSPTLFLHCSLLERL